jgi:hypothetical protein
LHVVAGAVLAAYSASGCISGDSASVDREAKPSSDPSSGELTAGEPFALSCPGDVSSMEAQISPEPVIIADQSSPDAALEKHLRRDSPTLTELVAAQGLHADGEHERPRPDGLTYIRNEKSADSYLVIYADGGTVRGRFVLQAVGPTWFVTSREFCADLERNYD